MTPTKYVNGEYIVMTDEEIAAMQEKAKRVEEELIAMPPSMEERMEAIESAFLALLGGGL